MNGYIHRQQINNTPFADSLVTVDGRNFYRYGDPSKEKVLIVTSTRELQQYFGAVPAPVFWGSGQQLNYFTRGLV